MQGGAHFRSSSSSSCVIQRGQGCKRLDRFGSEDGCFKVMLRVPVRHNLLPVYSYVLIAELEEIASLGWRIEAKLITKLAHVRFTVCFTTQQRCNSKYSGS